jgi:hypothetical protein
MASGCRDCNRCTERGCVGCARWLILMPLWEWIFYINSRKCPQCNHPLAWHERRRDGSFQD